MEPDGGKARTIARGWIKPYCRAINYQNSFHEQGYGPDDWEPPYSDRLIDDMVVWGDVAEVRGRIDALEAAGADHVAIIPLGADGSADQMSVIEELAPTA